MAILSGNDLEHLSLAFGCLWAGVPFVPVSPAYSLLSQDHAWLRHIVDTLTPGLVFASGPAYGRAIDAAVPPDVEVVLADGALAWQSTYNGPASANDGANANDLALTDDDRRDETRAAYEGMGSDVRHTLF